MKRTDGITETIKKLEGKRNEIDEVISDLKRIQKSGLLGTSVLTTGKLSPAKRHSAYKLAVEALHKAKKPLPMRDLVDMVLASGYTSKSDEPEKIVNTSLYKSISDKKHCQLIITKDQKIGLKEWK